MAGMLPGVEAARRRRVHQSSSTSMNSSCSSPSSRRLSFSLFSTNTSNSASTLLGHTTRSRTSYEDDVENEDDAKLGALAREAKFRLDAKLRSTPLKSTRNNNSEERIARLLNINNNENEGARNKKKKKKNGKVNKFKWNWKSGDQLQLQNKNNEECAVCLDDIKEGDDIMNLECDHTFHSNCLLPWLQTNAHCPCCRFRIQHF